MDPLKQKKEKEAFFEQLEACKQCKAFSLAAAAASVSLPPSSPLKPKLLPGSRPRRVASDPTPEPEATVPASVYRASTTDSVIPETEQHLSRRTTRRSVHPTTRVLRSQSDLEPSPSISMAKRKREEPLKMVAESQQIFKGLRFYYIPNNDVNTIRRMRIRKAMQYGVEWVKDPSHATHVIIDSDWTLKKARLSLDFNLLRPSVIVVNDQYPIACWIRGEAFNPLQSNERRTYKVPEDVEKPETEDEAESTLLFKKRRNKKPEANLTQQSQESSDLIPSSYPEADELATCIDAVLDDPEKHAYLDKSEPEVSEDDAAPKKKGKGLQRPQQNDTKSSFNQDRFMCMRGGTRDKKPNGPNVDTIRLFEEMAEEHRLSDEHWRVQSYRKAIATLRRQTEQITTAKEAKKLPNIGSSLADHIEEIARTGRFAKLENIRNEPSRAALKLFCNVYGVGVPTASRWVELGYRTLDDLRTKATLTTNQKLGVDHYDDLLTRIPRAEVEALGNHVKAVAASIDPTVELIISGSYRRGAETSGDIDMLVTKKGSTHTQDLSAFLDNIVETLTDEGFLTASVASHRHDKGNKWHGCCVLPKSKFPGNKRDYRPIWRRIDFLIVPDSEIGAALIYFTGNDLFNRSMRLLARKKKMRLNHRALSGHGVWEGKDEKKIFEILGVKWREPHERWC